MKRLAKLCPRIAEYYYDGSGPPYYALREHLEKVTK